MDVLISGSRWRRVTAALLLPLLITACTSSTDRDVRVTASEGASEGASARLAAEPATAEPVPRDNAELIDYLGRQPFVTAEAGYRAAYLLWRGTSFDGDFAALRDELVAAGIADRVWNHAADQRLLAADVGYLVCRAGEINRSLNWSLLRLGRYAWRDLVLLRIAPNGGGELNYVSGGEFQGILRRADAYVAQRDAEGGTVELGAAPQ